MLKFLKNLFGSKPQSEQQSERHPLDAVTTPTAPYKVPEPAASTPIPLVVETAPGSIEVVNAAEGSATQTAPTKAKAPAKPKKQQFDKKPAAAKAAKPAAAKAPAKPKAPKKPKISIAK